MKFIKFSFFYTINYLTKNIFINASEDNIITSKNDGNLSDNDFDDLMIESEISNGDLNKW